MLWPSIFTSKNLCTVTLKKMDSYRSVRGYCGITYKEKSKEKNSKSINRVALAQGNPIKQLICALELLKG